MQRHRSAALGLMLALILAATVASAQTTPPASDSASKAPEAVPNFFRDIQANAFASLGYISNLNKPQDQSIGLRYFDNRANTFSVDLAELVVQKAVAKAGDAGFRLDLTAGTFAGLTQSAGLRIGDNADLQQAFVARNALQCGYCTPGMLLTAQELLVRGGIPSREQIRAHLSGNYCRCTGYQAIVDAIESVAQMRAGKAS